MDDKLLVKKALPRKAYYLYLAMLALTVIVVAYGLMQNQTGLIRCPKGSEAVKQIDECVVECRQSFIRNNWYPPGTAFNHTAKYRVECLWR